LPVIELQSGSIIYKLEGEYGALALYIRNKYKFLYNSNETIHLVSPDGPIQINATKTIIEICSLLRQGYKLIKKEGEFHHIKPPKQPTSVAQPSSNKEPVSYCDLGFSDKDIVYITDPDPKKKEHVNEHAGSRLELAKLIYSYGWNLINTQKHLNGYATIYVKSPEGERSVTGHVHIIAIYKHLQCGYKVIEENGKFCLQPSERTTVVTLESYLIFLGFTAEKGKRLAGILPAYGIPNPASSAAMNPLSSLTPVVAIKGSDNLIPKGLTAQASHTLSRE